MSTLPPNGPNSRRSYPDPALTEPGFTGMTDKLHYIEFRHVYKTFDRPVLVDANFYVNAGETVAIIGRSGVGKSVSLGHIMGFLKPDEGRVFVAYQDITDYTEA